MRYLGIDYGSKRTGLAISDPEGRLAVVKETIEATEDSVILERLNDIILKEDVDAIVIGVPTNMNGNATHMTDRVERFVHLLANELEVPVYSVDERLTSVMAERMTREHKSAQTDQIAAQILLQNYLDRQNV